MRKTATHLNVDTHFERIIEDHPAISLGLLIISWLLVGKLIAILFECVSRERRDDNSFSRGLRIVVWPLELFLIVLIVPILIVGLIFG